MTAPTHAQQMPGKGRWYVHPHTGETWPSVTNVIATGVAKPQLVPWAAKASAAKAWDLLPLMVSGYRRSDCKPRRVADGCGRCRACLTRAIKGEHKAVRDKASDLGDRVHAMVEAHAKGTPILDDPEAAPFARQALRFFADFDVDLQTDVVAAEATVVNRAVGYAGTGDLWVNLKLPGKRAKRLVLIDYKTSSTRAADSVYLENGLQLAALARGETLLLDGGEEVPAPGPIAVTCVLNLRVDDYALVPMPSDGDVDAAFAAFRGALATALYIHSRYDDKPAPAAAPRRATRKVA